MGPNQQNSEKIPRYNMEGIAPYDPSSLEENDYPYAAAIAQEPTNIEVLEVHEQNNQAPTPVQELKNPEPKFTLPSAVKFSRNKALAASSGILVLVLLITSFSLAVMSRRNADQTASRLQVGTQDIQLKDESKTAVPGILQGEDTALLINGDLITRGTLSVTSGAYATVLRPASLTTNQALTIPNASGTICLDSNNCNFATGVQFQSLQNQLNAVPPSTLLNGQAGQVAIQGTSSQISVSTANGVIALSTPQDIAPISSPTFANLMLNGNFSLSGTVTLPLNCSTNQNGGVLTTNALGQIICDDDDQSVVASTINSPGGTAGRLAMFTAAQIIADSIISQALGTITIGGNQVVTGSLSANSLTLATALAVDQGGTGRTTFTTNGVLYGNGTSGLLATGAPISGQVLLGNGSNVPTFTTISGDITMTGAGVTAIQANTVTLTTDTVGDYVQALGVLTGLSTSGNTGEGSTPTLSVLYGSTANTAVQGNTSITVSAGTNLTGGGSITLGAGGTVTLNVTNTPVFTGNVTAQGGTVTIGSTTQTASLVFHDGDGDTGSINIVDLSGGQTYTLPNASGTFCLTSGNCVGGGGGSAPNSAAYITLGNDGTLTNERSLAAGNNITLTDGGANGNYTVATVNNPTFTTSVTTPLLQSSGALSITPAGALTVGATGQTALLQGSTTTITSNGAGNDIVLTSADQIRLTGFDCSALANGGKLTTDNNGNLTCAAENGGPAGGVTTAGGNTNRLALFSGSQTIADSWLLQNGSTLTLDSSRNLDLAGGNLDVTGTGTFSSTLTANGNFVIQTGDTFTFNGDAYTSLTGTGLAFNSGSLQTTLGTSVDLASAEVTGILPVANGGTGVNGSSASNGQLLIGNGSGYTLATLTQGDGITITNGNGSITVTNSFGTSIDLGTETTGDYQLGTTAGNGIAVTGTQGEGWSPTIALGQLTADWNQTGAFDLLLNNANSELRILESNGATYYGTIDVGDLSDHRTYTFPDASGTICLTTGNCAGSGGGVTTAGGSTNQIPKFTGTQTLGDSSISDNGTLVTINGSVNLTIQGGTVTAGTLSQAGTLAVSDGSNHTVSIVAAALANSRTYTLPDAGGPADFCLSTGNCVGGSGGGAPNAAAYLVASLDGTLTNERAVAAGDNISITDGGAGNNFTIATVQNPTFTTSVTTPLLQSANALVISSGSGTVAIDATTTIELQDSTNVTGALDVSLGIAAGTADAFTVSSAGAITAATGITSSGTIIFSALNCTSNANGGALTTDGSGQLVCSDDNGAAANTITGTGNNGTLALFNGTNTIADSIITQSSNAITITGSLGISNGLSVTAGGASIVGNTTIATTAGNTLGLGNSTGLISFTSAAGNVFNIAGVTVTDVEFNRLDGKDAALVDTNDAAATAITGTGALNAGSITSGFGAIDTGADNITTTGVLQGGSAVITGLADLQGNVNLGNAVGDIVDVYGSIALRKGSDFSTTGVSAAANFGEASLIRLTGASTQTISGIAGGRNGEILTLINTAGQAAVISNNAGGAANGNKIITGTGADISLAAGASINLVYDDSGLAATSFWRVVGDFTVDAGTCANCANQDLNNLTATNINQALNTTSGNLTLQTTTSGNIVLNAAGDTDIQDSIINSTGNVVIADTVDLGDAANGIRIDTAGVISDINGDLVLNDQIQLGGANGLQITTAGVITDLDGASVVVGENLNVTAGGITVVGDSSIATTAGNTLSVGNATGLITFTSAAGNVFNVNGATVTDVEFNRLDGKDAALVDTNDAVAIAITGTGALNAGSITSGFGAIDTGADNITTTGALQGGTVTITGLADLQGNINLGNAVGDTIDVYGSFALRKGTDFSTTGVSIAANFGDVSLVRLTGASTQTISGIAGGRNGELLTLVNTAGQSAVISNNAGGAANGNKIITGTGADISLAAGASISFIYDDSGVAATSFWRVLGDFTSGAGTCATCANQDLNNLTATNINQALNATSANLTLQTTTSGNIILNAAANTDIQDTIINSTGNVVIGDTVDLGDAANGIRIDTAGVISDINGDLVLNDQIQLGGANGLQITTAGVITDLDGASVVIGENLNVTAGGITVVGNSSIAATAGNTLTVGNSTGLVSFVSAAGNVFSINGAVVTDVEFNRLDGKDAALVDTNDAVATAITGTGALANGSITTGFGSISTANNISTTSSGTITSAGLLTASNGLSVNGNTTANNTATGTTGTTSGAGGANVTTITMTAAGAFAINDIIFVDNTGGSGQDYFTRITNIVGTTFTVDLPVSYGTNAGYTGNATITKYDAEYLGSDGTNFSGSTRNANAFYQGFFNGGIVVGAGSTTLSDGNLRSTGNLTLEASSGTVSLGSSTTLSNTGALTITGGTTLALGSTGANAVSIDTGGAAAINIGNTNANAISLGRSGVTTTNNGALTITQLLTANAGATVSGGAIGLSGNAASSFTTSAGALTITSAVATTWSTTAGNLTIQAGSGTISLGSTTTLSNTGALTLTPGGAMTLGATTQTALLQGSITTITSTGATNDIILTSADQIRLTGFNCTTFINGGTLTTDASGNIACADDDGGNAGDLQSAYDASAGGTSPEIKLDSTRGALDIQDANSSLAGNLVNVRASNAGGLGNLIFNVSTVGVGINLGGTSTTPTADLSFGNGSSRVINVLQAANGNAGNDLSMRAGDGNGTNQNGGDLYLQGGQSTGIGVGGSVIVKPLSDSTAAFQVQTSSAGIVSNSVNYSTTGANNFVVPFGVTSITVKMWGAGGGGGGGDIDGGGTAGNGGGGGFVQATLAVTPGEALSTYVGTGGAGAPAAVGSSSTPAGGGGGGGYSSLYRSSSPLLIAAGGGGGGGTDETAGTAGGAGGGTSGIAGSGGAGAGGGASQSSGGSAGSAPSENSGTAGGPLAGGAGADGLASEGSKGNGVAGGALGGANGGNAPGSRGGGGGGGGGYYGGGGGASDGNMGYGGGGGSSLTTGTSVTNSAGSGVNPGNNTDPDWGNAGLGGSGGTTANAGTSGANGRIIISWSNIDAVVLNVDTANLRTTINGSFGGNVVIENRSSETSAQTYNINSPALAYYISSGSGTTNATFNTTFNISTAALPAVDGIFAFFTVRAEKGSTGGNARQHTTIVQIDSVTVSTVSTLNQTGASSTEHSFTMARINGTWRVVGSGLSAPVGATTSTVNTADLAEWIRYTGPPPEPGDVLTVGDELVSAKKASSPYDTRLMGVVTTDPAEVYGVDDGQSVRMALTGRVPVKVTLENGPIQPGDMLTSSSTPGYAMKATRAGQIIGTALSHYDGTGDEVVMTQLHVGYGNPEGDNLTVLGASIFNGNLTVKGLTDVGHIRIDGHIITAGDAPEVEALVAAGDNAIVVVDGNDIAGTLTITTGTQDISAGELIKLIFSKPYGKTPRIFLSPHDEATLNAKLFPSPKSTTYFNLKTTQILPANTTYTLDYYIVE